MVDYRRCDGLSFVHASFEHHKEKLQKDRQKLISDLFFGTSGLAGCRERKCANKTVDMCTIEGQYT
jgi:hypothetical protein